MPCHARTHLSGAAQGCPQAAPAPRRSSQQQVRPVRYPAASGHGTLPAWREGQCSRVPPLLPGARASARGAAAHRGTRGRHRGAGGAKRVAVHAIGHHPRFTATALSQLLCGSGRAGRQGHWELHNELKQRALRAHVALQGARTWGPVNMHISLDVCCVPCDTLSCMHRPPAHHHAFVMPGWLQGL